ncbi:sugar phosphate nucleotidyltransferase [Luteitalea sp.]|jgi:mannose-1-phosphate guanylyltransferase|uniref:sugar phosphate nucleotidyltransferase n=1 Tax=Luteitalea sp. TaxID=2004800 RepID=UPI0037CA9EC3
MKAILLAGGKGTRLRPLTLNTPKPIVPIFNRPFLMYQLDQLRQVPEITEVILSLNYQPRRIEETFGDGEALGIKISYAVEPQPLGTGGAIKFSAQTVQDSVIVLNGDVLQQIDLRSVIARHRERKAKATIVLTPVDNPTAYGLVETDGDGNVKRFLEKPKADEITCNTINAGIYVLEPETLDRIPANENYSIERQYFPSLVANGETFVAYVNDGYWIDIGTPEKYRQVHRDIMDGRYPAAPFLGQAGGVVDLGARLEDDVQIEGPCFLDEGVVIKRGARIGPYAVLGRQCQVDDQAQVRDSVVWANTVVGAEASLEGALVGRNCHLGRNTIVSEGRMVGDRSTITDFSRL